MIPVQLHRRSHKILIFLSPSTLVKCLAVFVLWELLAIYGVPWLVSGGPRNVFQGFRNVFKGSRKVFRKSPQHVSGGPHSDFFFFLRREGIPRNVFESSSLF